jgi:hypothetical protein
MSSDSLVWSVTPTLNFFLLIELLELWIFIIQNFRKISRKAHLPMNVLKTIRSVSIYLVQQTTSQNSFHGFQDFSDFVKTCLDYIQRSEGEDAIEFWTSASNTKISPLACYSRIHNKKSQSLVIRKQDCFTRLPLSCSLWALRKRLSPFLIPHEA